MEERVESGLWKYSQDGRSQSLGVELKNITRSVSTELPISARIFQKSAMKSNCDELGNKSSVASQSV